MENKIHVPNHQAVYIYGNITSETKNSIIHYSIPL